jgi:hypothetical protein
MRKICHYIILLIAITALAACTSAVKNEKWELRTVDGQPERTVSIDTMQLRDPFVIIDKNEKVYYMTGTGGAVWKSKDLRHWTGPYNILQPDTTMWMGSNPVIWAPEIHEFNKKFYYMATFTRPEVIIDRVAGRDIPRRSCQLFVSDNLTGPYKPLVDERPLLRADQPSLDATFCNDEYGAGYIIYSHEWIQNWDGTVQIIRLTDDFCRQMGEPYVMFTASQNPWSSGVDSLGQKSFCPVMDGPFLFDTEGGELGMLFSTYIDGEYSVGVAYTEKNHGLNGPWHIEPEPLLRDNNGHPMMFNDFDGTLVMAVHKDTVMNGKKTSVPRFIEMDRQFDKLKIKRYYKF